MSERDDRYARQDLPSSTAEFRATPDISASTAQFQAFAAAHDDQPEQPWRADSWPEQPWRADSWPEQPSAGTQPARTSRRGAMLAVAGVVLLAVVITVIVLAVGG